MNWIKYIVARAEDECGHDFVQLEKSILHRAAGILRSNILEIAQTKCYQTTDEVVLEYSQKFVPCNLQFFSYGELMPFFTYLWYFEC